MEVQAMPDYDAPAAPPTPSVIEQLLQAAAESPTIDAALAGASLKMGRTRTYEAIAQGSFPVEVIRIGRRILVPVAPLLALLGLGDAGAPRDAASTAG
jgi:hypothetical protein